MKNDHRVNTKQHGDMKSDVLRSKNSTFSQLVVLKCTVFLEHVKVKLYPLTRKCDCFVHFFVTATVKLQEYVINEPGFSPSEQGSS